MAVDRSVIGKPTRATRVRVERGPVTTFADALKDENPVYHESAAAEKAGFSGLPVPPTYSFAWGHTGAYPDEQPPDPTGGKNVLAELMSTLMSDGGIILHGEEEFEYHRPIVVGDVLLGEGVVKDIYEKESKGKTMTFIVMETLWTDEKSGELALTERFNLIHRK
jgi:acyl dehydratase